MRAVAALSLAPLALAAAVPQWPGWGSGPPSSPSWSPPSGGSGGPPSSSWSPPGGGSGATAYVLDDDPAGANIVSFSIDSNGVISNPIKTATGGKGGYSHDSKGQPQARDNLGTSGSVTVSGNYLFTVNAGSNQLSFFIIDPQNPQNPKLIDTIDTAGDFPNSVDYSPELRTACVLNGGTVGGVSCFNVDPFQGLSSQGGLRAFPSNIFNQTNPPLSPPGGASQVGFGPDSSAVYATIRGYPGANAEQASLPGSIVAYPISNGVISTDPVVSQPKGLLLEFSFLFLPNGEMYLSDPSFGAAILTVNSDFTLTQKVHTVAPGEVAVCWTAADFALNTLYLIDAGLNQLYTLDASTGALGENLTITGDPASPSTSGVFDSSIYDNKLYGLAAADGIVVVDLVKKEQVQYFDLSSVSARLNFQGFAIYDSAFPFHGGW